MLDVDLRGETEPAVAELLSPIDATKGDSIIAFGWAAAESLAAVLAESGR